MPCKLHPPEGGINERSLIRQMIAQETDGCQGEFPRLNAEGGRFLLQTHSGVNRQKLTLGTKACFID